MSIMGLNKSYFRWVYQICEDMSQMKMQLFYFFTTEKKGALLIGHVLLYGTLWYITHIIGCAIISVDLPQKTVFKVCICMVNTVRSSGPILMKGYGIMHWWSSTDEILGCDHIF